ncbi:MAG TPA: ROK family transcriptional regulator [Spirochaetia bacterium]|nr:ROK family transcriptional regulator [Spirochaetia bacterium]
MISRSAQPFVPGFSQTADLKSNNTALVLYILLTHPHIARSEIIKLTRLAPSTVSNITADLIERGLIRRVGNLGQGGAGRKSELLARNPQATGVAAIHITPERCTLGVVDLGYETSGDREIIFDAGFTEADTDSVLDELAGLIGSAGGTSKLGAIGLAIPNHPYNIPEIERRFRDRFPSLPLYRINNTEAMAVYEYYLRLRRDYHTIAYVYVGTGIGSGLVINGDLYQGVNGNACDLGHMYMTDRPLVCRCGRVGCVETVASERSVGERLREHFGLSHSPVREELIEFLSARLRDNDPFVVDLLGEAAEYLGKAIFNLVAIADPQLLVVAGRFNALNPFYSSLVEEAYMARARMIPKEIVPIEFRPVQANAGLIGAAMFSFISLFCSVGKGTAAAVE